MPKVKSESQNDDKEEENRKPIEKATTVLVSTKQSLHLDQTFLAS